MKTSEHTEFTLLKREFDNPTRKGVWPVQSSTEDKCEHKWSAPAIAQKPIYNDSGVPISGASRSVAVVSCEKCGEIKSKVIT